MKVHRVTTLAVLAAVVSITAASAGRAGGGTPITMCAQTVTQSAFLTQDLVCTGSHGIVVGASGITIDLKGFTLRGDRTPGHFGISDVTFDQVTIKNGTVRNFANGVFACCGSNEVSVSNLVASGNLVDGIFVDGASASVKSSEGSGNDVFGIELQGVSASVKSSTASGNGSEGIHLIGASASVKSSTASGNGLDGITVGGSSAKIQSSVVSGNGVYGIVTNGDAPQIKGNRADANGFAPPDLMGFGILAVAYTTVPVGKNVVRGNDIPAECSPASLC
jgi:large repetitive protein